MQHILPEYQQLDRTTWVYISSLMTIALYFKFSRLWSVRNLDLLALIALAPSYLLVLRGGDVERLGYIWLFGVGLFLLARLLLDPMMVRRPLLEPNLSPGGLLFMAAALLMFLTAHVLTVEPHPRDLASIERVEHLLERRDMAQHSADLTHHGPSYALLYTLGYLPNRLLLPVDPDQPAAAGPALRAATVRTMAILSHLAIIGGLILVGLRHFGNIRTGVAAGALYLLLPYSAQNIARVEYALPAALVLWAVVLYRRPTLAGACLALGCGAIFYPLYLLPLWISFYWARGVGRFLGGVIVTLVVVVGSLALTAHDVASFVAQFSQLGGWRQVLADIAAGDAPSSSELVGLWAFYQPMAAYRIPVFVLFAALAGSMALWPPQKNLGTLLSCSAALMLGTQFWRAHQGGLYISWYLPLLLLTVLRPNLEDRIALSVLGDGWLPRRRVPLGSVERAA